MLIYGIGHKVSFTISLTPIQVYSDLWVDDGLPRFWILAHSLPQDGGGAQVLGV